MLTESVSFTIAIAVLQSGALFIVECDFQESAHWSGTTARRMARRSVSGEVKIPSCLAVRAPSPPPGTKLINSRASARPARPCVVHGCKRATNRRPKQPISAGKRVGNFSKRRSQVWRAGKRPSSVSKTRTCCASRSEVEQRVSGIEAANDHHNQSFDKELVGVSFLPSALALLRWRRRKMLDQQK